MNIGCISLVPYSRFQFVTINCTKGRGIILPGGKMIPGETFKETARRELKEETGLIATEQELLFHAPNVDGFYVFTFLTHVQSMFDMKSSSEGQVALEGWDRLMESQFKAYYELLKEVYESQMGSQT